MEALHDQSSDSPSKNSYIGSYYQPPDRILARPEPPLLSMNTPSVGPGLSLTTHDVGSKAVINALKALQEKIRRLELERKTAERNAQKFSQAVSSFEHHNTTASTGHPRTPHPASSTGHPRTPHPASSTGHPRTPHPASSTGHPRTPHPASSTGHPRIPHPASSTGHTWTPHLASSTGHTWTQYPVPTQNASNKGELVSQLQSAEARCQVLEKQLDHMRRMVEKAEQDKNALADKQMKMSLLEQKLKAEELERWRVQKKAEESTSPSHSVHANMQSLLHMMKHHQPQLCHRVRSLHQSRGGARKSLRRALSTGPHTAGPAPPLGSLSDLLLALQDELGQMSFSEGLQRELESLLRKMEDKGVQITKLRQHQHTVHLLNENTQWPAAGADPRAAPPPRPSPVRQERPAPRRGGASQSNLQLLKETQRFRNSLKTDDLTWET
ncbi:hypothetical protein CRUP_016734 [Coryphaenoides rupestris]|nr:hypothetical protein CRUP_016734 [Coryphaenoides rupestris]